MMSPTIWLHGQSITSTPGKRQSQRLFFLSDLQFLSPGELPVPVRQVGLRKLVLDQRSAVKGMTVSASLWFSYLPRGEQPEMRPQGEDISSTPKTESLSGILLRWVPAGSTALWSALVQPTLLVLFLYLLLVGLVEVEVEVEL